MLTLAVEEMLPHADLVIGAVLFGVYHYVQPAHEPVASSKQIQLSLDDLARMVVLFQSQWKREPTAPELERLMETRVQTEVLYREALAMGLDKDDEIVKRRMAQKMQFLAEDAAQREPGRSRAGATRAGLTLSYMGDVVTLDVRDDGVGFTVGDISGGARKGFGLNAMRQRVNRDDV